MGSCVLSHSSEFRLANLMQAPGQPIHFIRAIRTKLRPCWVSMTVPHPSSTVVWIYKGKYKLVVSTTAISCTVILVNLHVSLSNVMQVPPRGRLAVGHDVSCVFAGCLDG